MVSGHSHSFGVIRPALTNYHGLLTLNEVFCRRDYGPGRNIQVVVDIGANIGLAALFFLTRNRTCWVYCFEPDSVNSEALRKTLSGFEERYTLIEAAVTPERSTTVRFVPQGRFGHVATGSEDSVEVPAVGMVEAVQEVLARETRIDLVKIDTEGSELRLVEALRSDAVKARIGVRGLRGQPGPHPLAQGAARAQSGMRSGLAESISSLLADRTAWEGRRELGLAAVRSSVWDCVVRAQMAFYEEVLRQPQRRRPAAPDAASRSAARQRYGRPVSASGVGRPFAAPVLRDLGVVQAAIGGALDAAAFVGRRTAQRVRRGINDR